MKPAIIIGIMFILLGCDSKHGKTKVETKDHKTEPTVVEYMAGKPQIDAYLKTKATINDINEKQKKRIEQSLQQ